MVKHKVAKLGLRGRGITQEDVASVVGVHRVTVARVLAGRSTSGQTSLPGEEAMECEGLAGLIWRAVDLLNEVPVAACLNSREREKHLARIRRQVRLEAESYGGAVTASLSRAAEG